MQRRILCQILFAVVTVFPILLGSITLIGLSGVSSACAEIDGGDDTLSLLPDELRAVTVARDALKKRLKGKFAENETMPTRLFLSKIENYSVQVRKLGRKYEVYFAPKLFEGVPFKGGGTIYFIDAKSFKILKVEHTM